MFIKNNLSWINIDSACNCLELTRSSYYSWIKTTECRTIKTIAKTKLLGQIKVEYLKSKGRYGSIKITRILKKVNINCTLNGVALLMKRNNIKSVVSKKYKATTNSKHNLGVFDNVLNRQFIVPRPNYAWVSDITYIHTGEGWLYLATVLDLYSNMIIGHAMSDRMTKQLVITALEKALKLREYPNGVIVHTDRGSQYASHAYKAVLDKHQLIGSMSRKGNCWDNAVAENFFGIMKKEYVSQTKFETRNDAKLGIFDYIEAWYNTQRIHSKLGYLTPAEFDGLYIKMTDIEKNIMYKNTKTEEKAVQL